MCIYDSIHDIFRRKLKKLMRLILFERNDVVGDRSEGNLWLWDLAT